MDKLWMVFLVATPLLTGHLGAAEATKPANASSGKSDFIQTPPIPPEAVRGINKSGKGMLVIHYAAGKITGVDVVQTTGTPALDKIAIDHVKRTFQLRPGATGQERLPFKLGPLPQLINSSKIQGDFISTPPLKSRSAVLGRRHLRRDNVIAELKYQNGHFTSVKLLSSTGIGSLDGLLLIHIETQFKLRASASGMVILPIRVTKDF